MSRMKEEIEELADEVATLKDKIKDLEDEVESLEDDVSDLNARDLTDAYNDASLMEREYILEVAIQGGYLDDRFVVINRSELLGSDAFSLSMKIDTPVLDFFRRVLSLVGA